MIFKNKKELPLKSSFFIYPIIVLFFGGERWTCTTDTLIFSQVLYFLSYLSILVSRTGLEPAAWRLRVDCSTSWANETLYCIWCTLKNSKTFLIEVCTSYWQQFINVFKEQTTSCKFIYHPLHRKAVQCVI